MDSERTFAIICNFGRQVMATCWLEHNRLRVDLLPDPRPAVQHQDEVEFLDFVAEGPDGAPLSPAEAEAQGPDCVASLPHQEPMECQPDPDDLVAWDGGPGLADFCVVNASGFGYPVRAVDLTAEDGLPVLVLERDDDRAFRVQNHVGRPVIVTVEKTAEAIVLHVDEAPPVRYATTLAQVSDDGESYGGEVSWKAEVVPPPERFPDPEEVSSIQLQSIGYLTIGVDRHDYPAWREPRDLGPLLRLENHLDGTDLRLDLAIDSGGEAWPVVEINPDRSTAN